MSTTVSGLPAWTTNNQRSTHIGQAEGEIYEPSFVRQHRSRTDARNDMENERANRQSEKFGDAEGPSETKKKDCLASKFVDPLACESEEGRVIVISTRSIVLTEIAVEEPFEQVGVDEKLRRYDGRR